LEASSETAPKLCQGNALFLQEGYPVLPSYIEALETGFHSEAFLVDFRLSDEVARQVNEWISAKTEKMIPCLLKPSDINSDLRLVLGSAIYFKAMWLSQFQKEMTSKQPFQLDPKVGEGVSVQVDMMLRQGSFLIMKDKWNGYQALLLPYQDSSRGMLVLLPKKGKLSALEKKLDADLLTKVLGRLEEQEVFLQLPRFELDRRYERLAETLKRFGIEQMFGTKADFSGITKDQMGLLVSKIVHQARIKVDEEGTEAAAATVVFTEIGRSRNLLSPIFFIVDRPFLFLIYDFETSAVLFIGRVMNPKQEGVRTFGKKVTEMEI
jgi:serpin B